ncbi:MAG TPA: hypothetical protein DCX54_07385 [Flavobacteriales bacterium]|nr:hypothetical protein [Flavobacteriales bacterium]
MKIVGAAALAIVLSVGIAYSFGWLDAKVEVAVDEKVKQDVAEFSIEQLDKAKESTDKAFNKLRDRLND